jgi:acetyltransferase-like isoleucine patch superfamily enzyme
MFRFLALVPKLAYRIRGGLLRWLIVLAGGKCGPGLRVERGLRIRQGLHAGWDIGTDVYIGRNTTIDCLIGTSFRVGSNVTLTEGLFISICSQVAIGANALIGEYCSIRDANHDIADANLPITIQPMVAAPITIEENVWIGRGCAVLAGITVGHGSVIGANSVVTRTLPAGGIYAGSPAKLIRMRSGD